LGSRALASFFLTLPGYDDTLEVLEFQLNFLPGPALPGVFHSMPGLVGSKCFVIPGVNLSVDAGRHDPGDDKESLPKQSIQVFWQRGRWLSFLIYTLI